MRHFRIVRTLSILCAAALTVFGPHAGNAQGTESADSIARVARLAFIEGRVSLFKDQDEGWQTARLNAPIQAENSIWTEGGARADVRLGASAFRFDQDTVFDFLRMNDTQTLGYLQRGIVQVRVRTYRENDFADKIAIDTPGGRVVFETDGRYRVDSMTANGETRITVFAGRARFEQGNTRLTVESGRELMVRGQEQALEMRYYTAQETDLDRWADVRDSRWDRTHARVVRDPVISPYMTGYEDLDEYGEWVDGAEYGRVWAPRVVISGWAPYRFGQWTYVRPWGWTWIDDAPWGFAPFHYGRWVMIRNRWCWWPGVYHPRPAYAPALVAWFGSGGSGISISGGPHVGWFPLAPREHFVPRFPHPSWYANNINYVTGNVVIAPPSRYHNHRNGATIVANDVFIGSRPVGSQFVRRPPNELLNSPVSPHVNLRPHVERNPRVMPDRIQGPTPPVTTGPTPQPINPRPVQPTIKHSPEPVISGPAIQPPPSPTTGPAPLQAPVVKRAPEPILVGPSVAPPSDVRPPAPTTQTQIQPDRPATGPRVRGWRQPPAESGPGAAPISPAPRATPSAPAPAQPLPPTHSAPTPKPKAEPSAKPKEQERESGEKAKGERSGHPKAALQ